MRIIQVLSTIANGDAVSNDARAFDKVIQSMGYAGGIYAESIVSNVERGVAKQLSKIGELNKSDIIIYHFSTGTHLNYDIAEHPCRKIMVYHNVTPPEFFHGNDERFENICAYGLEGAKYLSDKVDYCIADSEFNKRNLIDMGYKCRIDVLPIIIPMDDYKRKPSRDFIKDYGRDGVTNVLFTGRIAPNKKQEDIIAAFYYYRKLYNKKSRLILAGSYKEDDVYYRRLAEYVMRLGIGNDVVFTGHVKFDKIVAGYRTADVFVCMSEHEGFCVPVVESMIFDVPVIAYDSTAVGDTLGGSGMLIGDKNPVFVAGCIDRVMRDEKLKKEMLEKQRARLKDFEYSKVADRLKELVRGFL